MSDRLLRLALVLDGIVCGANALAYLALASVLDGLLGLSGGLLLGAGVFLVPYAGMVLFAGTRKPAVPRALAGLAVGVNAVWGGLSLLALVVAWLAPTTLGAVWIVLQALVVLGLAGAQYVGLRRISESLPTP